MVQSTGYVITPFVKYPNLLDTLLGYVKTETDGAIRRQLLKVIGIIGAIDPYSHKMNQLQRRDLQDKGANTAPDPDQMALEVAKEYAGTGLSPSSEEYYPTVAISALMHILRDPTLATHHKAVVSAVISNIFTSLQSKCVPFLPQVVPTLLTVMHNCGTDMRSFMFQQLAVLVSITKQHIRDNLPDIFGLIRANWKKSAHLMQIISLVEEISCALKDEFQTFLPDLLPQLLNVVYTERAHDQSAKVGYLSLSLSLSR